MTDNDWLAPLLRPNVESSVPDVGDGADTSRPFEGLYGAAYSAMIRRRVLRRAFFSMWGDATPLFELDDIVRAAGEAAGADSVILDVPCGRGVVAELLATAGVPARIVGLDLASRAVELAADAARHLPAHVDARYVRGTALDLPFRDGSIGSVISINGLHVMPDHERFVSELARVLEPGGDAWLITPVSGGGISAEAMLRAGQRLGVLSQHPPTRPKLESIVTSAGFDVVADLGGTSVAGLRLAS